MTLKVLATGDIHMGRTPSVRDNPELAERASAIHMWEAIVEKAIDMKVDAVLLSGDIVNEKNRLYEATGPLERGINKLADQDIHSYAVAGNHDWDVFPRIVKNLGSSHFHLLGEGGTWGEAYLEREGQRLLRLVGWSFPARHVRQNPLEGFRLAESDVPTIGLLHADLVTKESASDYAPVSLSELQHQNLALWVLGHIHKPQHWNSHAGAQVLYPGSPQALSPSEPGIHGPWMITLEGSHSVTCQKLPMSRIRYEQREVDLTEVSTEDDLRKAIFDAQDAEWEGRLEGEATELLSLRLTFVGATPLCGEIDALTDNLDKLERPVDDGVLAVIDKVANLTQPAIDLKELATQRDPAGELARTLLGLESGEEDETVSKLLDAATARLQKVHRAGAFSAIFDREQIPDREAARELLIQQSRQFIEALRAQKYVREEAPA